MQSSPRRFAEFSNPAELELCISSGEAVVVCPFIIDFFVYLFEDSVNGPFGSGLV
jgi:hypothetical protein